MILIQPSRQMLQSKKMANFKAIAAMSLNRVIGYQQQLPWHIPEELKWFRHVTLNQTLLMGRKTFESMGSRPLPQRKTYVLTRNDINLQGVQIIHSPEALYTLNETIWVCGGESIYKQLLPVCEELILSVIPKVLEGDTFFPYFESEFKLNRVLKKTDAFEIQSWVKK